jgi:uncharacterized RDD family membrane protein YckC
MTDEHQDETQELQGNGTETGAHPAEQPTLPFSPERHATPKGSQRPSLLAEGQRFGRYRVVRELGRGGMGEVYEAEDTETGRLVALKLLPTLGVESLRKRFVREGRLAAQVSHPNSVYVFEADEIESVPVIAMEILRGGTLAERVAQDGAFPVHLAVDSALQIIAGLREAEGRGILHRDVKPSNCFIEQDGTVKVGDYGLSMSVAIGDESTRLTTDGSQLGTPAFAPPEQMRGRETDVRSDIYSVGATLYYLLTGRPPFEGSNAVELIAKVLGDPVVPPRQLRPDIPKGLERVVLRCLAREPDRRYADYEQLAKALAPFRAQRESAAHLGTRFAAGFIDQMFLMICSMFYGSILALADRAPDWDSSRSVEIWASVGVTLAYFVLLEGIGDASLGKRLFGLRVVRVDGRAPGLLRAAARTLIYAASGIFVFVIDSRLLGFALTWTYLLLWVTARRRNGYAAIHDLVTGTRVVHRLAATRRARLGVEAEPPSETSSAACEPAAVGPFEVLGELPTAAPHRLLLGCDPRLRRNVWLHLPPPGTPPVDDGRRNLARTARLRWLGGRREGPDCWDAYEAPGGASFRDAVARTRSWPVVRDWLHDLAREIEDSIREGHPMNELTTEHVWIGEDGRARLLDLPLIAEEDPASYATAGPEGQRRFLVRVAREALEGRPLEERALEEHRVEAPLPLHARRILEELRSGAIADGPKLLARLDETLGLAREVEPARRTIQLGIQSALPAFGALILLLGIIFAIVSNEPPPLSKFPKIAAMLANIWAMAMAPLALGAVATAFALRGGLSFRVMQIAVIDRWGYEIGRARAGLRSLVAWSPLLVVALLWLFVLVPAVSEGSEGAPPRPSGPEAVADWGKAMGERVGKGIAERLKGGPGQVLFAVGPLAALVFLGGAVYAVRNPTRGLQDRLLGTQLVPR